ncbi:MAG TPA: CBS domain-containing protein, partial [Longimicrobiales bacterium]|nr:CBS domain-containing protein [Longimicrobiales bacterium]
DKIPSTLWFDVIDEIHSVGDRDAFAMARRLTRREGLFVGGSAGLIAHVAVDLARRLDDPESMVVCVLPDTGERYLSKLYNDEWMRENRLVEPERLDAAAMLHHKDPDTPALIVVDRDQSAREALALITGHDVAQLPVLAGDRCVGAITEPDLMARVIEDPGVLDRPVSDLMETPFPTVDAGASLEDVARLLTRQNPAVVVRENGALTGIITRYDMVRQLTG